ncbi:hypothetical protein FPV82_04055 [Vibrio cholerae]|uniref:Uncharacterized protein n=1 Tax=Vibrio cholerae TaxID=666 RepID=A0A5C9SRN5_VIBCL|nr:hypothetical protein F546_02900 [Vibrio paracholerae 877-163]MBG8943990.1 hypothetical protein [Vibrio cholerae]NAO19096.1 hypothetical protein [Vibrio cholerae]NAO56673.1 hypothetical protein [Vibrio cholerae]TVM54226.1 hypothetical protein FPV38_10240 [Vibrio cholerae]
MIFTDDIHEDRGLLTILDTENELIIIKYPLNALDVLMLIIITIQNVFERSLIAGVGRCQ